MDKETWARHTNPLSVYSRFTLLPLIALSLWSRIWLGWWSLLPLTLTLIWTWLNPRVFPQPKSTDNWASKGPLGEQIFINKPEMVSKSEKNFITFMGTISGIGFIIMCFGIYKLNAWPTIYGMTLSMLAKAWVVDRMVWLYEKYHNA